ncbi:MULTISPECIES: FliA/WhiG family RNA polymerase sigma factor [Pelosinus]|uniref:RNA polymerase sigma factor n=1 Tax=Pelosinus fermentans B4 TaxID=1149862 RepID=I9LCW4_9FIRM|nr:MULTISPECIES: FliA/WhiG family RNA polymerase sigma factor [Pelosinus]EIW18186.1 RNA polymerase sigma factor, FliA/WhiG family [Pelosinus fermentans B4]EIW23990.1 RNA polymerase, sigma 28 subunit, FliA/WhiG [Pelosinus fermentans A11]OAM94082.1 RNA polymerase, sigma 28 subunit, FliA/WhiG [Pelosinus fermentans DSM 17108]SDQ99276.1 RNA polymerase sigma factor for flagellar operon FliA [Pelosinus fermentans]
MLDNKQAKLEEIMKLWLEYQQGRKVEIREKLIEYYLSLVKLVASRIAISLPQYVDKDDLISNGFFGLLDAIEKYDPMRGIKFETYAVVRIRGSMLDAIRAQDWVPTSIRQKAKQYEQTVSKLENQLGRAATDNEIAEALSISVNELYVLLNQLNASTIMPLDEFIKTETSSAHLTNPSEQIEIEEVKQALAKTIDKLPEKERLVVSLYYYEGLTLKEISLILKLSEARISQLHTKSIFRLRGALSRIKSSFI